MVRAALRPRDAGARRGGLRVGEAAAPRRAARLRRATVSDADPVLLCGCCSYRCRAIGTASFAGVSGYLLWQRASVPRGSVAHRATLAVCSAAFAAAAVFRFQL